MGATAPWSGLIIEVPEAEHVVSGWRAVLDVNARLGVPAHVTILFPFVPPRQLDDDILARLQRVVGARSAFDYSFSRTAWFEQDVLWLAPDDPDPFRELTRALFEEFPAYPPFEGAFDEVVPHLTVGHGTGVDDLRAAEQDVRPRLPVAGRARAVSLLVQDDHGRWSWAASIPLADA